jgi:hypothetical protein
LFWLSAIKIKVKQESKQHASPANATDDLGSNAQIYGKNISFRVYAMSALAVHKYSIRIALLYFTTVLS